MGRVISKSLPCLALALALCAVTACQTVPSTSQVVPQTNVESQSSAPLSEVQRLGLQNPGVLLKPNEFQIQGTGKQGLAGAEV